MTSHIRLVLCLDSPGWGGAERDLLRVLPWLGRVDEVWCGERISRDLLAGFCREGIRVEHMPTDNRLVAGASQLPRWIRHLHASRRNGPTRFLVWTHHSDSNRWLQIALAACREQFCIAERLLPATEKEARNSRSRRFLKSWIGNRAFAVVLCGYSQRQLYRKFYGVEDAKIYVIPNSRDVAAIREAVEQARASGVRNLRDSLGLPADNKMIINVGRLEPQKDQETLVRAVALLRAKGRPVSVILVGDGAERRRLQRLGEELAPGGFLLTGEQPDPVRYLAAADMFAMPSLSEGLPGALIEAMAAGLPCVTSNVPGVTELIQDKVTGLTVRVGDAPALATAMASLLDNPGMAADLAKHGYEHVADKYDMAVELKGWSQLRYSSWAEN